jgi:choline dehydrogenase-like flavoprotein
VNGARVNPRHVLSEGAEKLVAELQGPSPACDPQGFHCDVLVVGSGYGGAVAAARFAGATRTPAEGDGQPRPARVWVLERGLEHPAGSFPATLEALPGHARVSARGMARPLGERTGLFDLRLGPDMQALVANGLGGGSLINAGVLEVPHRAVFDTPQWPRAIGRRAFLRAANRVRRTIDAQYVPDVGTLSEAPAGSDPGAPDLPDKTVAMQMLAHGIGRPERFSRTRTAVSFRARRNDQGVEQAACVRCGDCFTGCNVGAKNTLDRNYLALARARGARLVTGATVLRIRPLEPGWAIAFALTDPRLARADRGPFTVHARHLVLAAGTYGSTELLMKSRDAAFTMSPRLGHGFSGNGDVIAVGHRQNQRVNAAPLQSVPLHLRGVGPTITAKIDLRDTEAGFGPVIEELAVPAALRRMFEEVVTNAAFLVRLGDGDPARHPAPRGESDPLAHDAAGLEHAAIYAIMGHDGPPAGPLAGADGRPRREAGRMKLAPATQRDPLADGHLTVHWPALRRDAMTALFNARLEPLRRGHADPRVGGTVLTNPVWQPFPDALARALTDLRRGPSVTVHPLGGCCIGETPTQGVVNPIGQVWRGPPAEFARPHDRPLHDDLAVLDGSIVPTSLGINPSLTIAALAELAVPELARQWGLTLLEGSQAPTGTRFAGLDAPPPGPVAVEQPTAFELSERMIGTDIGLRAPFQPATLSMELSLGPLRDAGAFAVDGARTLPISASRMTLVARPEGSDQQVEPVTFRVGGEVRVFTRRPSFAWVRRTRALAALLLNRGIREWRSALGLAGIAWRMSTVIGTQREFHYAMRILDDVRLGGVKVFGRGDLLIGVKSFEYGFRSNPWQQITTLRIEHEPAGGGCRDVLGNLQTDSLYFAWHDAFLLRLARQSNLVTAIADLGRFLAFCGRALAEVHAASFGNPEYPGAPRRPAPIAPPAQRLPGPLRPAIAPERHVIEVAAGSGVAGHGSGHGTGIAGDGAGERIAVALSRYRPAVPRAGAVPVLLIHGLGAAGNTFTEPSLRENLAEHLLRRGREVWVVDLRTSLASACAARGWAFDDVALNDLPAAVDFVRAHTGAARIDVVAHCVGSAMLSMAVLMGRLDGRIRRAALSQVGLAIELSPYNVARGHLLGAFRALVPDAVVSSAIHRVQADALQALDRVLTTFPYPRAEWFRHHPWVPLEAMRNPFAAQYNRISGIYGQLFNRANLSRETLHALNGMIGQVNLSTYAQTLYYASQRRLTDRDGRTLVTRDALRAHYDFPVLFVAGRDNQVFDSGTATESLRLLEDARGCDGLSRALVVEGYGHQDCMIGRDADRDVYPAIGAFLATDDASVEAAAIVPRPAARRTLYASTIGPVLGRLDARLDAQRRTIGYRARLLVAPDAVAGDPAYFVTLLQPSDELVDTAALHDVVTGAFHRPVPPATPAPAVHTLEVDLPPTGAPWRVIVLGVHENEVPDDTSWLLDASAPDPGEWAPLTSARPMRDDERRAWVAAIAPGLAIADGFVRRARHPAVDTLGLDLRDPLPRRIAAQVSAAALDGALRPAVPVPPGGDTAPDRQQHGPPFPADVLDFVLAGGRQRAFVLDRTVAGASLERLAERLRRRPPTDRPPSFLLLAGDIASVDATAGLLANRVPDERAREAYLSLWADPGVRAAASRLPVYPLAGPQDIALDVEGPSAPATSPARAAYQAFVGALTWPPPGAHAGPADERDLALRPAGFPLYLLDTLTGRQPRAVASLAQATLIDDRRFAAFEQWLLAQPADVPKFVACASALFPWPAAIEGDPAYALRCDGWAGYPASLARLLGFVARHRIAHLVFLTGGLRAGALARITLAPAGDAPLVLHAVLSGRLYAPLPFANPGPADLVLDTGPRRLPGGIEGHCEVLAPGLVTDDHFAQVSVQRAAQGWSLDVRFDCADRRLDGHSRL